MNRATANVALVSPWSALQRQPSALGIALAAILAISTFSACGDGAPRAVEPATPDSGLVDSAVARQSLQRLNPYQWVGTSHNSGLDVVRAAYREGKLAGRQACREFLELDFSTLIPLPMRAAHHNGIARQYLADAVAASECQPHNQPMTRRASATSGLSPAAQSLLNQIDSAIEAAASRGWFTLYPLATISASCTHSDHPFRTLGSADFKGAIGGAISGAFAAGPQGAALGAIYGGVASSVAIGVQKELQQFWCDLRASLRTNSAGSVCTQENMTIDSKLPRTFTRARVALFVGTVAISCLVSYLFFGPITWVDALAGVAAGLAVAYFLGGQ